MPLLTLLCPCGHTYEALRSFSTRDPDLDRCPKCGGQPSPMPAGASFLRDKQPEEFTANELAEHLEAKAYYESPEIAAKILSGEITLKEKGPKWLRPQCPETLRKRYY